MNLSSCRSRALFLVHVMLFTVVGFDRSDAAMVSITAELGRFLSSSSVIGSNFGGGYGNLRSHNDSFTFATDTVADTAALSDIQFGDVSLFGDSRSKTITTITPPTSFPDPPIVTTTAFTEMVTFDPITPANFAPQLVSSTAGAITYNQGFQYRFPSNVVIAFPDSFTVSGNYKMQGPTEMVTVPFSVIYSRTSSANVSAALRGLIYVGTNFPDTASIRAHYQASADYGPATDTIFDGTVDGQRFKVVFQRTTITVTLPVPEPATRLFAVMAISLIPVRRR